MRKSEKVAEVIHQIVVLVDSIMKAVIFVQDEVKTLKVPDDVKEEVLKVTNCFQELYYFDIRKEVNNLCRQLMSNEPRSNDIACSIVVIRDDLGEQVRDMIILVEKLNNNSDSGDALWLVMSHAADIAKCFLKLKVIVDEIEQEPRRNETGGF